MSSHGGRPLEDENGELPAGYLCLWEELRFEHQLLGSRMTYDMTSQSFPFTHRGYRAGGTLERCLLVLRGPWSR